MKEETKEILITILSIIIVSSVIFGSFVLFFTYMFDKTEKEMHQKIQDKILLNNSYQITSITSDFVSGNECNYFVSITLRNQTNEIKLNDFHYDTCENKLYYGWYHNNYLDEQYGKIIN